MSLITRCPACQTLFRVVPDQLRISEGWVRCGQCDEIFDATPNLLPEPQQPAALPGLTDSQSVPDDSVDSSGPASAFQPSNNDVALDDDGGVDAHTVEASFLQQKRSDSFWRKRVVRATLILLGFLLLLGLSGQILFHERDRLLAMHSALKPWLLAFCQPLNCTLAPLRQIEYITIDSSSFMKVGTQTYRLTMTLKNTATLPLAAPAVEVTLTNSLDQPVVRRVVLPSELGANSTALEAGLERSASLILVVKTQSPADPITGYRLLAFYP